MRFTLVNITLGAIIGFGLSPLVAVYWSSWFAKRHDCSVNEGFKQACIVDGQDWGPTLYTAFASGWLILVGLPIAILATIYLVKRMIRSRKDAPEG